MPKSNVTQDASAGLCNSVVLIVDDQPDIIQVLSGILAEDYKVLAATSAEQALAVCRKNPPDLILMDVMMPGINGLDACRILKSELSTAHIPIIFITSFQQQDAENECWQAGGIDFISKPVNPMTVKNRVRAHLLLKLQQDMLLKLVYLDGLTCIFNRRYFDVHLPRIIDDCVRSDRDVAVLLIDIDFFKPFNDNYGHLSGDAALKQVAQVIQNNLKRPADFVARYGGEEFVVVLPDTDRAGAEVVAEQLRENIFAERIEHSFSLYNCLTVSIGVSSYQSCKADAQKLTELADQQLYSAKQSGRNRVCSSL